MKKIQQKLALAVMTASTVVMSGCMSVSDEARGQKGVAYELKSTKTSEKFFKHESYPLADVSKRRMLAPALMQSMPAPYIETDRENYNKIESNLVQQVSASPVSTFSVDVDTAAYANVRRMLQEGRLPRHDAVRIEEMINYFSYNDHGSKEPDNPFAVNLQMAPTPWNEKTQLLRVGIKAWDKPQKNLPATNLVFLVDVSGSMYSQNKLPLLKKSLKLLTRKMREQDKVTLVTYAGASGVVLEPTSGNQSSQIEQALDRLRAGGSTNGGAGIHLAYAKARESFIKGGINRVVIATDGDFNVGTVNHEALIELVKKKAKQGVSLTTLGFGRGNYNDHLMEQLADKGNGNYAYIDSLLEANKVLVEQMGGTLLTVAKDVKIQVEFNPSNVRNYRLLGYENRLLAPEDFNNDKVDAGEIGAGHSVVALYEVTLQETTDTDPLRYATHKTRQEKVASSEYAFVKIRHKAPEEDTSQLTSFAVTKNHRVKSLAKAGSDLRFAAAVAAFGQQLRGGKHLVGFGYDDIRQLAQHSRGDDEQGYRAEFLRLVSLAKSLDTANL